MKSEIISLSKQYGVLSKFTSFVGVKKNRNALEG